MMGYISDELWAEIQKISPVGTKFRERLDRTIDYCLSDGYPRNTFDIEDVAYSNVKRIYELSSELSKMLNAIEGKTASLMTRQLEIEKIHEFAESYIMDSAEINWHSYFYNELTKLAMPMLVVMAKNAQEVSERERSPGRRKQKIRKIILGAAAYDIDKFYYAHTGKYISRGKTGHMLWISKVFNLIDNSINISAADKIMQRQISWRHKAIEKNMGSAPPGWDAYRASACRASQP